MPTLRLTDTIVDLDVHPLLKTWAHGFKNVHENKSQYKQGNI